MKLTGLRILDEIGDHVQNAKMLVNFNAVPGFSEVADGGLEVPRAVLRGPIPDLVAPTAFRSTRDCLTANRGHGRG